MVVHSLVFLREREREREREKKGGGGREEEESLKAHWVTEAIPGGH
jgi:hypothetical protein